MYVVDQVVSNSIRDGFKPHSMLSCVTDSIAYVSELFGNLVDDCLINSCAFYHRYNDPCSRAGAALE